MRPLRGERPDGEGDGGDRPGKGPARGYSWPPFEEGNFAGLRHGAKSGRLITARAREIMAAALEDPGMPDHLRSGAFRAATWGWAKAEAAEERLLAWVEELGEAALTPAMPGTRPPFELWRAAASHAANMRSKLGLDPRSYASISRDLGLTERRIDENIRLAAVRGAEIIRQRFGIEQGEGEGEGGGDGEGGG